PQNPACASRCTGLKQTPAASSLQPLHSGERRPTAVELLVAEPVYEPPVGQLIPAPILTVYNVVPVQVLPIEQRVVAHWTQGALSPRQRMVDPEEDRCLRSAGLPVPTQLRIVGGGSTADLNVPLDRGAGGL